MPHDREPRLIVGDSLDDILRMGLEELLANGHRVEDSRKGANTELLSMALHLRNPRARLSRTQARGKVVSSLAEFLWYASGSAHPEFLGHYIKHYAELAEDQPDAYGPRLFGNGGSISWVTKLLRQRPHTRRALAPIIRLSDYEHEEMPCTCDLQFIIREGELHLIAHLRSNDAMQGFVHDVFCFTMIQEAVASELGTELGGYTHVVGSYHLYDKNLEAVERLMDEGWQWNDPMPPMPAGHQWANIHALLEAARAMQRQGDWVEPPPKLPNYWQDLAVLLAAFERSKRDDVEGTIELGRRLVHEVYLTYVDERADGY